MIAQSDREGVTGKSKRLHYNLRGSKKNYNVKNLVVVIEGTNSGGDGWGITDWPYV